jgi:RNA polymerase sigma-70 factor (ECF subfamily)
MPTRQLLTDDALLVSADPEAFGMFYDRYARPVLGYFAHRTGDPEAAADLTAETFASAIVAKRRFRPSGPPAIAWLFGIAHHRLADHYRSGRVDDRVRRSLQMERRPIDDEDARLIRSLADDRATALLVDLSPDQREAVRAHVIDDRGYPELADDLQVPEATVRQRVSRGLATMRRGLGGPL